MAKETQSPTITGQKAVPVKRDRPLKDQDRSGVSKTRLLVSLTQAQHERLEILRRATDSFSLASVVRDALDLYQAAREAQAAGKTVGFISGPLENPDRITPYWFRRF